MGVSVVIHNSFLRTTRTPLMVAVAGVLAGCSGDTVGVAPSPASTAVFSISLNQHAINMSLTNPSSNTIQLSVAEFSAFGQRLANTGQVTFVASDSGVSVTPAGLVTAQFVTPSNPTKVIVTLSNRKDNLTLQDSAYIRVTRDAPVSPIRTFSIQPVNGDSASRSVDAFVYTPVVSATNSVGEAIPFDLTTGTADIYALSTSNQAIASVVGEIGRYTYHFDLSNVGHITLYATSWVYGVAVKDSLPFVINWPLIVATGTYFTPKIFIGTGGVVDWVNTSGDSLGVVFDDPATVDSAVDLFNGFAPQYTGRGNVYFTSSEQYVGKARRFPIAGTYTFHNPYNPAQTGAVLVFNNP